MDRKISLGIEAVTGAAVSKIKAVTQAQDDLKVGSQEATKTLKAARGVVGDVRAYENMKASLGSITAEISTAKSALSALERKQTKNIELTETETVELKQQHLALSELNKKKSQTLSLNQREQKSFERSTNIIKTLNDKVSNGIKLSDKEQEKLATSTAVIQKLNEKKSTAVKLTIKEQQSLIKSTARIEQLTKKKNSLYQLNKKEQKEVVALTKKLNKLTNTEKRQASTLDDLSRKLDGAKLSTNDLSQAQDIARRRAEKAANLLERENRLLARSTSLQERKKAALASMPDAKYVAAGAAAVGGYTAKKSMDNETEFVDVAKLYKFKDGNSGEEAQKLRSELNKIAVEMAGVDSKAVMEIAAGGANGGVGVNDDGSVNTKELATFTRDTVMTSTAWDMTPDEAAKKAAALSSSLAYEDGSKGQAQFMRMANMINTVSNKNKNVYAKDLLGAMTRSGSTLVNSGFSESGAISLSAALLSKGAKEEEAGTATRNISKALTAGQFATKAQTDVFDMLGLDSVNVAEDMQIDAMGTLSGVLASINELDAADRVAATSELFGADAAPHINKILNDPELLTSMKNQAKNASNDSVKDEYKDKAATKAAGYEQSADALNNLAVVLGDRLLPVLEPVREAVTGGVIALTDFLSANEALGTVIAGGVTATVGAIGVYKAYQALKFVKGIASLGRESAALRRAQSATDRHTDSLNRNARAADRASRADVGGSGVGNRRNSGGRRNRRRRSRGKFAAVAGLGITALSLFSSSSKADEPKLLKGDKPAPPDPKAPNVETGLMPVAAGVIGGGMIATTSKFLNRNVDAIDAASDVTETVEVAGDVAELAPTRLASVAGKVAKAAKVIRPIAYGLEFMSLGQAVLDGDMKEVASSVGAIAGGVIGGIGGGLAGGALTAGVGAPIGAIAGNVAGAEVGERLGEWVYSVFSTEDLNKSEQIKTAQIKEHRTRQVPNVTFAPQLVVQGGGIDEEAAQVTLDKMQELLHQFATENGLLSGDLLQDIDHSLVS
ncbi:phage tail tape measure protein [Vibrio lentus]|nr:phage tail tape measure protein [Vibrio lentus]PMI58310.1 phage tail tape measure protein [Vibrio lentus]